ncbi:hypothetical protein Ppb6_01918 [Photorhabdus australis subsp. thailandensis]|uniref:Uncharacterized protein n=1 Tax=Photorhabdus australis subsp. thailandensis TaxID=2805096 RepID=A0A1C0U4L2_9GAMM|nr:hypothetical protein [Photorhabdus australis]OCQ52859.1 hypothetical protein Ppb6_01918 [Photorhabdus australis subsp. thailandensis]
MKLELISINEPESLNSDDADQGFKSVLKETMNDVKFVKEMKRMSSIHKDKKRKVKKEEPDNLCFSSFQASSNLQFNADRALTNDNVSIGGELSLQGLSDKARLGQYNKTLPDSTRVREGFQLTESNLRFNADRALTNNKVGMEGKLSPQGLSDNVRLDKCDKALLGNTQIQQEDFQKEDVSKYIHIFSDIVKENLLSLPYKFQQGLQYLSMVSSERIVNSYVPKNNQIKGAQDFNHCDRAVVGARFSAVEVSVGPMFKNTGYKSNSLCSNISNFDNSTGCIQNSLLNESIKYTYLANLKNSPADAFYRNPVARNYRVFFKGMRYLFKITGEKAWFNEGGEDDCS